MYPASFSFLAPSLAVDLAVSNNSTLSSADYPVPHAVPLVPFSNAAHRFSPCWISDGFPHLLSSVCFLLPPSFSISLPFLLSVCFSHISHFSFNLLANFFPLSYIFVYFPLYYLGYLCLRLLHQSVTSLPGPLHFALALWSYISPLPPIPFLFIGLFL